MKKFGLALLALCVLALASPALASFNQDDITNFNNAEPPRKDDRDHGYKYGWAKCVFDPSGDSDERTIAAHGCGLTIPDDAIVIFAAYKVLTTFTSATDAATIAIHVNSANDIVSAAAISTGTTWDATTLPIETIPKIETSTTWIATTAAREVTFTVAVEALTAGKMVVWVQYLYYGDA